MHVKISREALAEALDHAFMFTDPKSTTSVLRFCELRTIGKGSIQISATDYDTGYRTTISGEVLDEGGTVLLDAKLARGIVRVLTADTVEIRLAGFDVVISGGPAFTLRVPAGEEFPTPWGFGPNDDDCDTFTLPADTLRTAIRKGGYAPGADQTRPSLCGLRLVFGAGGRKGSAKGQAFSRRGVNFGAISTDGARMAVYEAQIEELLPTDLFQRQTTATVVELGFRRLSKVLDEHGEAVRIDVPRAAEAGWIKFHVGTEIVTAKTQADEFPDFVKVMPPRDLDPACGFRVRIGRESLAAACRRLAVITSGKTTTFSIRFTKAGVRLGATNPENGSGDETIPIIDFEGVEETIPIGINYHFLLDALDALDEDEINFYVSGGRLIPARIEGVEDSTTTAIVGLVDLGRN